MRLPDTSLTVALASGGREFFGWGVDRNLLADNYDALNQNTRACGNWAKAPPNIPSWPRPGMATQAPDEKAPVSVASLYNQFQKR